MSSPRIEAFLFDDENEEKFASHGLSPVQVDQVLDTEYHIEPNRRNRRGLWLVVGKDYEGQCIAIPVEATHEEGVFRPITAWRCKKSEIAKLP